MLAIGSYHDIKTRTVDNDLWTAFGFMGVLFAYLIYQSELLLFGIHFLFFPIIAIGGFAAWYVCNGYLGAADVKAMMALSVIISAYSFITIMIAVLAASVYSAGMVLSGRVKIGEIKKVQAPFIPFFLVGLLGTLAIAVLA